ncbi:MAG TPA: hypothetical protein VMG12_40295 [Polyangiaceae bacterium]|nr:hypothetical protein [Polyangiaceae bacterium]
MNTALRLLETELSHPSSFDEGVEAARNACAAGASIAAAAIAAAAYYDNPLTGLGALRELMARLRDVPNELAPWSRALARAPHAETDDHFTPGFGFVTPERAERTLAACRRLVELAGARSAPRCDFLLEHQRCLAELAGPLNETGLAALAYLDAGVDSESAERRWLEARLSVAIAEAQRARRAGVAAFPFAFGRYVYDGPSPAPVPLDLQGLKRKLGLDGLDRDG